MSRLAASRYWRWAGWTTALLALALVFAAYHQPAMLVSMAQQIWSCF